MYIKFAFLVIPIAKYRSTAKSNADVDLAFYMFKEEDISQDLKLASILPREEPYEYTFSVANNDGKDRTETAIHYEIELKTTTNLPLTFKVYDSRTIKIENGVSYRLNYPLGVDVDLFPLDGCPSYLNKRALLLRHRFLRLLYYLRTYAIDDISFKKSPNHPFLGWCLGVISHCVGNHLLMKQYVKTASKYKYENNDYVAEFGIRLNVYNKKELDRRIKVPFEGHMYYIPDGYDAILRSSYGDYMMLPPLDKRIVHHGNKLYWKHENN